MPTYRGLVRSSLFRNGICLLARAGFPAAIMDDVRVLSRLLDEVST